MKKLVLIAAMLMVFGMVTLAQAEFIFTPISYPGQYVLLHSA